METSCPSGSERKDLSVHFYRSWQCLLERLLSGQSSGQAQEPSVKFPLGKKSLSMILGLTRFLVRFLCPLVRGQHSLAVVLANCDYDHHQGAQGYLFTTPTSRTFLISDIIKCYH